MGSPRRGSLLPGLFRHLILGPGGGRNYLAGLLPARLQPGSHCHQGSRVQMARDQDCNAAETGATTCLVHAQKPKKRHRGSFSGPHGVF